MLSVIIYRDKLLEVTNNIQTAHNSEKDLIKKKNRGYLDGLAMALQKLKTIQSLIKSQEGKQAQ